MEESELVKKCKKMWEAMQDSPINHAETQKEYNHIITRQKNRYQIGSASGAFGFLVGFYGGVASFRYTLPLLEKTFNALSINPESGLGIAIGMLSVIGIPTTTGALCGYGGFRLENAIDKKDRMKQQQTFLDTYANG